MKYSEFRRWLIQQGAILTKHRSGSSHFKVFLATGNPFFRIKEQKKCLKVRAEKF